MGSWGDSDEWSLVSAPMLCRRSLVFSVWHFPGKESHHYCHSYTLTCSNFGKLNYYLGARAKSDGRDSKYPQVDFCKDPEVICSSPEHKELKWIAGEFYWMESVQSYNEGGWDYMTELIKFVEGGMSGNNFIDAVSGIVNRGCHNPVSILIC